MTGFYVVVIKLIDIGGFVTTELKININSYRHL